MDNITHVILDNDIWCCHVRNSQNENMKNEECSFLAKYPIDMWCVRSHLSLKYIVLDKSLGL